MVRKGIPKIQASGRTLAMLEAIVADGGRSRVSAVARATGVPVATAHRQVVTLVAHGYLVPARDGTHIAGPRLLNLLQQVDEKQLVTTTAAPVLADLASRLGTIVQLGTLENDMVTYRIKTGTGAADLFTKIGMQLEAYCSAIGKVLLADLIDLERDTYLTGGPFPALTARTLTDASQLARELETVRAQGFATDEAEVTAGLICIAAPIRGVHGRAVAAISISKAGDRWSERGRQHYVELLLTAARAIESAAFMR